MNIKNQELIYIFTAALKSKFFFCNNYDDTYYQFTNKQIDNFVNEFLQNEDLSKLVKKED